MIRFLKNALYRYVVLYGALFLRGEWMWIPLKSLMRTQYQSREELELSQIKKLNKVISSAGKSEFYRRSMSSRLKSLNDVSSLPLLEKEDLRNSGNMLLTSRFFVNATRKTSGGSTGAPVTVVKPARAMAWEYAASWRGMSWAGVKPGSMQARFWGVPMVEAGRMRACLVDLVTRRIRFSAFKFGSEDLEVYAKKILKVSPDYIYGYTSMVYELAVYIKSTGLDVPKSIKSVVVTSEVLTESARELISDVFRCKVFNEYGCGELGTIAHECEHGRMHINSENLLVEIVDHYGGPVENGVKGEVVVTDLNNTLMPLIRYRLKDYASISDSLCSCGRTLPVLEGVYGRSYEFIKNSKGEKFHGEFFLYILEELAEKGCRTSSVQFVRMADVLKIYLVISEERYDFVVDYMTKKLRSRFCKDLAIEVRRVDFIEREQSGKLKVIKNII